MKEQWHEQDGYLVKKFHFDDFQSCFAFMTRVAFFAEKMNHHPDWSNSYNELDIKLRTHDQGKITDKDYKLADKIDSIK